MSTNMYTAAGDCPSNEELALRIQAGDEKAAELLKEYRTLFHIRQLGDDVFSISYGGDPAKVYDRYMRWVFLLQLMKEVLKPRELNLVRYYLGIGQLDEQGMTFQELAIRLNYNGPSGAEKAYKNAIRKLKKNLHSSAYEQWLSIQRAICRAKQEAEVDLGYMPPQATWIDEGNLMDRFLNATAELISVHRIFFNVLEKEE